MNWFKDIIFLTLFLSFFFFLSLGVRPLASPDEARYSEIPREMLISHDFVTPHLNGIKYFEKPPLIYWIQAASLKIIGLNEWAARAPTALFGILTCLITYGLGRFLYSRKIGIQSSFILATSLLYFAMSHVVTIDMTLTFLLSSCLAFLLLTLNLPLTSRIRTFFCYGFYFFSALSVLAKGLIGILFPGGILFFWVLISNEWRLLKTLKIPTGILLFLIVSVPWHMLVQIKNPEFFHFYIVEQQFLRFFTFSAGRYQPAWFFFVVLILGFFPWTLFLIQALINSVREFKDKNKLFFLIWTILIFSFFSFSKSKLIPYILPIFPPLSILIAEQYALIKKKMASVILIVITLFLLIVIYFASQRYIASSVIYHYLFLFACILAIGGIINTFLLYKESDRAFVGLTLWAVVFDIALLFASLSIESTSVKPLLDILKNRLKPDDYVVNYDHYYQDAPFYLNRLVILVNWKNELAFGMLHQNVDSLLFEEAHLWKVWDTSQRIYIILDERQYQRLSKTHRLYFISKTGNDVLISNQP